MNKFLKFHALSLLALLAFSPVSPVVSAPPPSAFLIGKADSVSIPIQIVDGIIYVPTVVNGRKARFVLDSGAETIFLATDFARKLGFSFDKKVGTVSGTGGGIRASQANLKTLEMGSARLEDVEMAIVPFPQVLQADGILGYSFFDAFVVTIDYKNSRLILTMPNAFQTKAHGLPLSILRTPFVRASIDGYAVWLLLDTGDNGGVTLNAPFVEREKLHEKYTPRYDLPTARGFGGIMFGTIARAKMLTLGPFHLSKPIVELSREKATRNDRDGSIGYDVLSRFRITFDYRRKKLYLIPNKSISTPFEYERLGAGIDRERHRTTIISIIPGSPAAKAGIKIGDEVLTVNGIPASRKTTGDFYKLTTAAPGTVVRLTLRHKPDGKPFTVRVVLRDLL